MKAAFISAYVEEVEIAVCFFAIHDTMQNVLGPTSANIAPVVDFMSVISDAILASQNRQTRISPGLSPIKLFNDHVRV